MRQTSLLRRATPWLWGILVATMGIFFGIAGMPVPAALFMPIAFALLGGLGLVICISALLAIRYRALFEHWPVWAILAGLLAVSGVSVQYGGSSPVAGFQLLGLLLLLATTAALLMAVALMLKRHDVGLPLAGIVSLVGMWTLVILWRVRGDFLAEMFASLFATEFQFMFWFNYVYMLNICCVIPIALLSTFFHTGVQIAREFRADK